MRVTTARARSNGVGAAATPLPAGNEWLRRSAYGDRCAVCGVEAAHVMWLQAGGPDDVRNGLVLCALHHAAFDRGRSPSNRAGACWCRRRYAARAPTRRCGDTTSNPYARRPLTAIDPRPSSSRGTATKHSAAGRGHEEAGANPTRSRADPSKSTDAADLSREALAAKASCTATTSACWSGTDRSPGR